MTDTDAEKQAITTFSLRQYAQWLEPVGPIRLGSGRDSLPHDRKILSSTQVNFSGTGESGR
jgi:hypothetical protein